MLCEHCRREHDAPMAYDSHDADWRPVLSPQQVRVWTNIRGLVWGLLLAAGCMVAIGYVSGGL